ncbi:response regulator transcription factor [Lacrimispora saccharolytica]|nr:response regulator transcription factor [Lacrimispora saccharolytica]
MTYRLLIADDDEELVKMLKSYLEIKGFEILTAGDGLEVLEKLSKNPDLILLDINMPRMDGIEVCRKIRNETACPILFLTARVEEQDRVNGLLSGGDDYITKPFSLKELEARITAHLKREERQKFRTSSRYENGLWIDYAGKEVRFEGKEIPLIRLEYEIVEFLSAHPGQVFDRERIYERVCGYNAEGDSRVVTELVRRIRKKFSVCLKDKVIETVWGSGYRWKK